jgi:hypothetical protein
MITNVKFLKEDGQPLNLALADSRSLPFSDLGKYMAVDDHITLLDGSKYRVARKEFIEVPGNSQFGDYEVQFTFAFPG